MKYLSSFRWQPIVLTVDPNYAAFPDLDWQMESEIPRNVSVYRTKSWDPYSIYAVISKKKREDIISVGFLSDRSPGWRDYIARWVRANIFLPDARVGWNRYALKAAREIIENKNVKAILTTGPPHSTHLIGKRLKQRYGISWIADFRDPWTNIDFLEKLPLTCLARFINRSQEISVLNNADSVAVVSPTMLEEFQNKTSTHCTTIYNGFDHEDFENTDASSDPSHFIISHVGNINAERNPLILWDTIKSGIREGKFEKLRIQLVGNVDQSVINSIRDAGIAHLVERIKYVNHQEAISKILSSTMLLLLINRVPSAKGIITGKLFEYLASEKPILGIGPVDGDAAKIIKETGTGVMIDFDGRVAIEHYLQETYNSWKHGEIINEAKREAIIEYSRKSQTKKLANILDKMT